MPDDQHPGCPAVTVLPAANRSDEPWRNGGGSTRQVAALFGQDGPAWRLSMARVESDGPFSVFPGVTRTILVMDGDEMLLNVDGTEVLLGSEPFTFDGAGTIRGTLRGSAVTDFNVMVKRGEFNATTERIAPGHSSFRTSAEQWHSPGTIVVVAPASGARIEVEPLGLDVQLAAYDAVRIDGVTSSLQGTIRSPGSSVLVVLTPER